MEMRLPDIPCTTCSFLSTPLSQFIFISYAFILCLSISILSPSIPRDVFPGVLLLLNHNIKQNAPPETSHAACYVFLPSLLHTPVTPPHSSPPFATHDVRPCPDSPLFSSRSPRLLDVFQAVPEKSQRHSGQAEQSGDPRCRLQHQGHGQWQLHVQVCPHAHRR